MSAQKTDYLPAALTRLLLETPDVSLEEIMADLDAYYVGSADVAEVAHELAALEVAGSVEGYDVNGTIYYRDADS
jgi:hypothetical protein